MRPFHYRPHRWLCILVLPAASWAQTPPQPIMLAPAVTGQFQPLPNPPPAAPLPAATSSAASTEPARVDAPEPTDKPSPPTPAAAKPTLPEGCRPVTDLAMVVDLKAVSAQSQKLPLATQIALYDEAVALWTRAVAQCEGRARERAQRNLADSLKVQAQLGELNDAGPKCESAHKDAATLQDLARQALSDRRFAEAAVIFRKSEDAWDNASELCTGTQQEVAQRRREQSEIDGHNAQYCAPVFERAREQTQKLRGSAPTLPREEKLELSLIAETLWRDAMAQCKGAVVDAARNQAQAIARERGTPWVARALPAPAPVAVAASKKAAAPPAADAKTGKAPKEANSAPLLAGLTSTLSSVGSTVGNLVNPKPITPPAAPPPRAAAPVEPPKPSAPDLQPSEFVAGTTRFNGQFVRDTDSVSFSGAGKVSWANGDVFDGTLVKGLRQGKGRFVWANGQSFEGDWSNDAPSGKGVLQFANGNRYEGEVSAGIAQGAGRMQYASGDVYVGHFAAGVPSGRGAYTWKNGQAFDGDWKDERPHGQGKLKFANGNQFEGTVVQGIPNGPGRLVFATGEIYVGQVSNGEPDGAGSFTWTNGDQYVGQWKAGKKHGQGVFTWKSGERWEGIYENDVQR